MLRHKRRAQHRHADPAPHLAASFMSPAREDEAAQRSIQRVRHPPAARRKFRSAALSGGNQQKVVFAKELLREPRLLAARRADARRRRRRQGRDLPAPPRARRARARRPGGVERNAGADRAVRPDRRHAAGAHASPNFAGGADEQAVLAAPNRRVLRGRMKDAPSPIRRIRGRPRPPGGARSARADRALPERHRPRARADRRRRVLAPRGTGRSFSCRPTTSPTSFARSPRPASSPSA